MGMPSSDSVSFPCGWFENISAGGLVPEPVVLIVCFLTLILESSVR